ncbi:F-actin-monooxygenase mical2b isoform X3 [Alosa alosa]|uniref:F-actin-monooxygenase mical2b isoform X3 n=1 Tax=Alosa alosa TaxID=278164 RepID=UPI002015200A|nr:F-actin-monooxygenase mical2b isoform X3 [Alosa alosa]XP_048118170.1 F-actin-monooxygenase mical2b isoform X3 [Alosa alosa]
MADTEDEQGKAGKLFENFVQASTCKGTLQAFNIMCRQLELDPLDHETFYSSLKARVTSWKAKALWSKLDKRTNHKEYKKGAACAGTKCLIIGGGPCGLRTAIELALLGAKVVVIEKRDTFSRNNVLHLWPYTIHDLRGLGAKKFYGKFCAGAIDHISIRQLQLMLLKIALLVAVEFHVNVEFVKLLEPPEDQENEGPGWRAELRPADHPVADFDFDVVVGADGRRNTLEGFKRKEFRGKLAIAITANFINRNTTAEAKVEEISGVAFIFNQKFFMDLKDETGIDLENIVYYRDNTHYFVMTAKKQSLLDKGVIINDYIDTEMLLNSTNVDQEALLGYAREAADYATHYQLPTLDFAMNHLGQPDVAMFDFTCMYASENAALVRERFGHQLLVALVGDSLLEPFWPMGTGCARGFLAAFDTAWMVKSWAQGRAPIEVLAERESLYRLLPQTTPANIAKDFDQYTVDPGTRYPNLNSNCVRPHQVRHLYINGELKACSLERAATVRRPVNLSRRESEVRPGRLQTWCQKQTDGYRGVSVCDLTSSWANGLALCALIHRFRPGLIDYDSLNEEDCAQNLQLAFDVSEREFGIKPFSTGKDLAGGQEPDKVTMVTYLSKFYELFRGTPLPPSDSRREGDANDNDSSHKPTRPVYKSFSFTQPRKRIPKDDKKLEENDPTYKRRRKICSYLEEATNFSSQSSSASKDGQELKENKVKSMATQLLAKFEERAPSCSLRRQSELCAVRPRRPLSLDMTESPLFTRPKEPHPPPPPPPPPPRRQSAAAVRRKEERRPPPPLPSPQASPLFTRRRPRQVVHSYEQSQPNCADTAAPPASAVDSADGADCHPLSPHSAIIAIKGMMQRMQRVEDEITQRKAQTQNAREFHKKSIKEKAVHLSSLFSSSETSAAQPDSSAPPLPPNSDSQLTPKITPAITPLLPLVPECPASSCPPPLPLPPSSSPPAPPAPTFISSTFCLLKQPQQRPQELDMQLCRNTAQRQAVNDIRMRRANTSHFTLHKQIETPQSKQEPAAPKQRTVGKVSLVVGARAETIASLYESDHRPKANSPPTSPGSFRRELGGSELCHACNRRVYVVERISAEGLFFHRECFRCDTCSASLSQGRHAFDSETGKLYCKLHFAQRTSGVKRERAFGLHMRNHGTDVQDGPETDGSSVGNSARQSPVFFQVPYVDTSESESCQP